MHENQAAYEKAMYTVREWEHTSSAALIVTFLSAVFVGLFAMNLTGAVEIDQTLNSICLTGMSVSIAVLCVSLVVWGIFNYKAHCMRLQANEVRYGVKSL